MARRARDAIFAPYAVAQALKLPYTAIQLGEGDMLLSKKLPCVLPHLFTRNAYEGCQTVQ
jgi:hypothetical protein